MEHPYKNEHAFEKVAICGEGGGSSWNIAGVWRERHTGRLYGDTDSGCSCYGPFEGDYVLGDLKEIVHEREAAALLDNVDYVSTEERLDFCHRVREAITAQRSA